jgi:heat shock protein 90kDa beta
LVPLVLASTAGVISAFYICPSSSFLSPSFLVADQVYVASVAAHTPENPNPQQYIFSSSSDDNDFTTYPDPRGKTLERGTEITLVLKPDALEFLDHLALTELINKHSVFSSSFPIYLFAQREKEVAEEPVAEASTSDEENADRAEDEAVIEEVQDSSAKEVKMKKILVDEWDHVNARPSLWTRYLCLLVFLVTLTYKGALKQRRQECHARRI